VPVLRLPTHDVVDVAHRVVQVVLPDFVADDLPVLTDRPQQPAGHRAGTGTCFEHRRAGEDIPFHQDLRGILGVNHRGASGHGKHLINEEVTEAEVLPAHAGLHDGALVCADDVVVTNFAL